MIFSVFFPLLGQFLRILSPRIATMGFTSPCCWPGWDFFCRTTALSPMLTTCTTNTQVGLQQLQHLPATPNLGRPWPHFQESRSPTTPITCLSAGTSIVFDMSLTYILVALVAVILNNALVELLSLHTRISVGEWGSPRPLAVLAPRWPPPPTSISHPQVISSPWGLSSSSASATSGWSSSPAGKPMPSTWWPLGWWPLAAQVCGTAAALGQAQPSDGGGKTARSPGAAVSWVSLLLPPLDEMRG